MKEMANIYASLMMKRILKNRTAFSAPFDKQDEDDQILDEIE